MSMPLILAFDIGTQSVRAMLVDKHGVIVDYEQIKYDIPYYALEPGWAEQDAEYYFDNCCNSSKVLLSRNVHLVSDIKAVAMATFRDSPVCLDKQYKPLRKLIVWLDKREATEFAPIPAYKKAIFSMVKMQDVIEMQRRQSVCNWIMQNQPELWDNTDKYVMLSTYLNYRFTGVLRDSVANMIGHIPLDYKKKKWMDKNGLTRFLFDVPQQKLCDLCQPEDTIGYITSDMSAISGIPIGLPLIGTGSDKGCETLGLSVKDPHQASLSFGTTATIQLASQKYFEPIPFAPSYPAVIKGYYNSEIQVYRGYWMVSWFKKEFATKEVEQAKTLGVSPESLLNQRLQEVPAGSDGLLLQPFWGPGVGNPNAKGAIIGFSDVHTRIHIYRAIIEGIGYALLEGLHTLERRSGRKINEIFVGGGGSQSDEICQITADIFGIPIKRIQTHESCGIGAAMVAFVALGEFDNYDHAIKNMVHESSVFYPEADQHKIYTELYREVYKGIYKKLEPMYKKIKKITRSKNDETL